MERPFFSIVMPAYQAEKYLGNAVEGILDQSFPDWELLIIEDCSKDRTLEIAEKYQAADKRIKVIHREKNAGVSEARNLGIERARGEYLWFTDADDKAERELLEKVHDSLEKNRAKLVVFGLAEEYFSKDGQLEYRNIRKPRPGIFRDREALRKEILGLEQQTLYGYPWNKVYDLDYLKGLGLRFEDYRKNKFIEDILFNIAFCMDIDSMNLLDIAPYHYGKRGNESLTNEFVPEYYQLHRRRIQALWKQQNYWRMDLDQARNILGALYARYILSALERNFDKRAKMGAKERRDFCRDIFRDELFQELVMKGKASESRMLKIALRLMKSRNITLNLLFAYGIHIARHKMPVLYSKIKSGR